MTPIAREKDDDTTGQIDASMEPRKLAAPAIGTSTSTDYHGKQKAIHTNHDAKYHIPLTREPSAGT